MSRYRVSFAYAGRLSGSRAYEVGVDLTRDFEQVALLVAKVSEREFGARAGHGRADRVLAVARYAEAIAAWAEGQVVAGQLETVTGGDRRIDVPGSELVLSGARGEPATLTDGDELLTFET